MLIEGASEIRVVSPSLPSRFEWLASDTDHVQQQADERLGAVIGQLAETGAEVSGEVGADDPMLAFEDAGRDFAPDHLLIGLRAAERADWQERGLLARVQDRFAIPITTFTVPDGD